MVTISWTSVFSGKLMAFFSFNKNIWKYFHMVSTVFQNEMKVFKSQQRFTNLSNGEENFVGKKCVGFVFSTTKLLDYLLMNESQTQHTSAKYLHWILPTEYVYQFGKWYHKMHISILFFAFRYICNLCTLRFALCMFVSTILVDLFLFLLLLQTSIQTLETINSLQIIIFILRLFLTMPLHLLLIFNLFFFVLSFGLDIEVVLYCV